MSEQLDIGVDDPGATLQRAWELSLRMLATKESRVTFETWIAPTQPLDFSGNVVTLGVQSAFAREWLERKAASSIRSALELHLGRTGLQVRFVVLTRAAIRAAAPRKPETQTEKRAETQQVLSLDDGCPTQTGAASDRGSVDTTRFASQAQQTAAGGASINSRSSARRTDTRRAAAEPAPIPCLPLLERYTMETFLVGRSNRLAYAGARSVAEKPGDAYNPLFVYGGPGLGKTHLLQAIAWELRRSRPEQRVAYVSGEYFAQHYITAVREHATEAFRRQYREVDVWLVDDIQFIAGKEHTKEEFFHTFNALYQSGKQIVIASDRSPRDLNAMDERLRSRFQSGLIADISAPELETRMAILQDCCSKESAEVSMDVITYIASAIQSNIRALKGALTRLLAYSSIMSTPISPEMAHNVLGEYFIEKPIRCRRVTVDEVVDEVAKRFGLTAAAIKGPSRNKDVALARHIAMYVARELMPEMNTIGAGAAFGGRDHATIIYARHKLKTMMEADSDLRNLVSDLIRTLSA